MQVIVPEIAHNSEALQEAEILALLVRVGEHVLARQPVLELEAGEASFELASPATGKVEAILVRIGDDVRVGDVVLTMRTQDPCDDAPRAKGRPVSQPYLQPVPPAPVDHHPSRARTPIRASPAARRRAAELGVDLEALAGATGRVTVADVEAGASQPDPSDPSESEGESALLDSDQVHDSMAPIDNRPRPEHGGARSRGYRHIQELVDVTSLDAARRRYHDQHDEAPPLRILSFVVKACAIALREHPRMNSRVIRTGRGLAINRFVHLGVALDGSADPAVLVLEHADQRPIAALAAELAEALASPREPTPREPTPREPTPREPTRREQGSRPGSDAPTFVVTSMRGLADPWTRRELSAGALAFGRLRRDRGRVQAPLQLAYDPRIHDQAAARAFLASVTELLRDPFALLMRC